MDLINAVREGNVDAVRGLLQQGTDVHAKNDSALRAAARRGNAEFITALLANGANVHANGDEGTVLSGRGRTCPCRRAAAGGRSGYSPRER
jgi:ankyrin repeat protein